MRDEELRQMFRSFAEPVAGAAEPPDPRRIRARGRRRRRNLVGGTLLAVAAVIAGAVGVLAGLMPSTHDAGQVAPPPSQTAPGPATTAPAPPPTGAPGAGATTSTTLPLGRVSSLDAVQVTGPASAVVVGKDTILATRDGGRTWVRVWRGKGDLRDVNFSTASTGWVLGDGLVLATADGGQHWTRLAEPSVGALRRVHFVSRTEGWGVAGGGDQAGEGPMVPTGATRLVHSVDGGRTWGRQPSFTLPAGAGGPPFQAELQCADPAAAWVRFSGGGAAAGHSPYALYTTKDGGGHWRGVLAEANTLANVLRLPAGPGSYPGPFSVIDPSSAFLLSPTPAAEAVGGVLVSDGVSAGVPEIPASVLFEPASVSFASLSRGWAVGRDAAGRAVILATGDGGRHWTRQLRS